jgi:hypothetical protein
LGQGGIIVISLLKSKKIKRILKYWIENGIRVLKKGEILLLFKKNYYLKRIPLIKKIQILIKAT